MKLVKTSLRIQLKQTNLENRLHILRESPKEGFNDTVFQHFVQHLQLLVSVFLFLHSIYLFAMLPFRMVLFITCFALYLFLVNLQYFSLLLQGLFAIFNENLLQ